MNQQTEKLVGVEVSQAALRAVCLDDKGVLLDSRQILLQPGADVFPQLLDFIDELKQKWGGFTRVGVAVPGLVNRAANRLELSTHMPESAEIDFAGEIKKATGLEAVLENDANAAAHGEYVSGAGRGSENMLYVTLGKGIGGAFILNGRLWRGVSGFAGELGHTVIDSDGMKLEEVASSEGIVRRIRNRFHQDRMSSLWRIGENAMTVTDVVNAANDGDGFARMMLERTGMYVGTAIASVINLLNIERIVISGEILQTRNLVLNAVVERARELSFEPSFNTTRIVAGELGESAAAVGVALLPSEK